MRRNFSTASVVGSKDGNRGPRGRQTHRPGSWRQDFQGLKGLSHTRFGGPGENNPRAESTRPCGPTLFCLTPRQHCRPSATKRKNFVTKASPSRPEPVPDVFGKEKGVK